MYLQPPFEELRTEVLHRYMRAHPLATFIVTVSGEIVVNHMPLQLDSSAGEYGALRGHIPRDNPIREALEASVTAVAVFQGANTYITPSWYPSKHADGKAVPTWNYAVVHAHGRPRLIDNAEWLLGHLEQLTDEHESRQALPWKVSDAPKEYTERMIRRLVGLEMPITKLVGKWKVSQNRPKGDRLGVAAGLASQGDAHSAAMAELVMQASARSDGV